MNNRSSILTDGWAFAPISSSYSSVRVVQTSFLGEYSLILVQGSTYHRHLAPYVVRKFTTHLLTPVHSPKSRKDQKPRLILHFVCVKIPAKKSLNQPQCNVFEPVFAIRWLELRHKPIMMGLTMDQAFRGNMGHNYLSKCSPIRFRCLFVASVNALLTGASD